MRKVKNSISLFFTLSLLIHSVGAKARTIVHDIDSSIDYNKPWFDSKKSEEENFKKLFEALKKSETGKAIILNASLKAREYGNTLYDIVAPGDGSLTDTTLIRRFSASDPTKVMYETRSKVYVNRRLKTMDAVLDFAHELIHFTYREPFNPYTSNFHLKDFIVSTVEGRGGEVDAFLAECRVLKELSPGPGFRRSNCQRIVDSNTGELSKVHGVNEFYKVGSHFPDLVQEFKKFSINQADLPKTSNSEALFISSAYGLPYPVAAVKEYTNIMDRVCKNDQNRIKLLQASLERSPASVVSNSEVRNVQNMFEDFQNRCERFVTK